MIVGFSGTQSGMTPQQSLAFGQLTIRLTVDEFHHGMCVGSDEQAHQAIRLRHPKAKIVGHPPKDSKKMANVQCDELREPLDYLVRNENIARAAKLMIITPKESEETVRSGTWATVRRARKARCNLIIIWPNGSVKKETFTPIGQGLPVSDD